MPYVKPGDSARSFLAKLDRAAADRAAADGRAWPAPDASPAEPYQPAWDATSAGLSLADLGISVGPAASPWPPPVSGRVAPYLSPRSHISKDEIPEKKSTPPKLYYCPRSRFVLVGPDSARQGVRIIAAPCKSNSCPFCGRRAMARKQRRIMARLEEDQAWGHDKAVDYRFLTNTLRAGAFYADADTLWERVTRRLAGIVARRKKLREKRADMLRKMLVYREQRAARCQQKTAMYLAAIALRDSIREKGFPTGKRDADIERRRLALEHYCRNTALGVNRFLDRMAALVQRQTVFHRSYNRKFRGLCARRRRLLAEDAGLTPEAASLARAYRVLKVAAAYARRQVQRPRKARNQYSRPAWEGCRLECINDVDIHPHNGYPHVHGLNWLLQHDGASLHDLSGKQQRRFLRRLTLESHFYLNNALRNACLELPLPWRGNTFRTPYRRSESWGYVHDGRKQEDNLNGAARSTANCVRYMCFHNNKIWKDGRYYPPRYRRFAATKNLLARLPVKEPSAWRFVQRSLSHVCTALGSQHKLAHLNAFPLTGSEEVAQDGAVLGLSYGLGLNDYRLRWALGEVATDALPDPSGRDPGVTAMVRAADDQLAPLREYWDAGADLEGLTLEQWLAGEVAPSLAQTLEAPSEKGDPFAGPKYHPETWRFLNWGNVTLADASYFAEFRERALTQKAARAALVAAPSRPDVAAPPGPVSTSA